MTGLMIRMASLMIGMASLIIRMVSLMIGMAGLMNRQYNGRPLVSDPIGGPV